MTFSDFVENVMEFPMCFELKHRLDALYELYVKDHEKCVCYLASLLSRGSVKCGLLTRLPLLLELYKGRNKNEYMGITKRSL